MQAHLSTYTFRNVSNVDFAGVDGRLASMTEGTFVYAYSSKIAEFWSLDEENAAN